MPGSGEMITGAWGGLARITGLILAGGFLVGGDEGRAFGAGSGAAVSTFFTGAGISF